MSETITALLGLFIFTSVAMGPAPLEAKAPATQSYLVSMTGYNAVPGQTDGDPYTTASGAYSDPDVVAARSRDLADELPFGTVIAIEPTDTSAPGCGYPQVAGQIGYRVVADTMNSRFTKKIDILFNNSDGSGHNPAKIFGSCQNVRVRVVGHVDINHMPKSQSELAAAIDPGSARYAVAN